MLILTNLYFSHISIPLCRFLKGRYGFSWAFQVVLMVRNTPASAGDIRDTDSIPGSGRSPGEENGIPLQYSCLENPMNRGAWQATIYRVTKSQTQLK